MKRMSGCLAACILAFGTSAASAATSVSVVSGNRGVTVLGGGPVAQTFVATDSLLTSFGFQFGSSSAVQVANVTFSLLSGSGLGGTTLATSTTALTGLRPRNSTSYTFYDVFNGSVALTAGQTYTALLTTSSSNLSLIFGPDSTETTDLDAYLGGALIQRNTNDISCRTGVCDANFRFTATATPVAAVPETSTWILMLAGFGAVGTALRYRRRATTVRFA